MNKIYFDENKEAYAQKQTIEKWGHTCISEIDTELWQQFNANDLGESWDIVDGEFLDLRESEEYKAKALAKAKDNKHAENLRKAYEAEENGVVSYKDALFETSVNNIAKLTANASMLEKGFIDSIKWLSKDDKSFDFTMDDIAELAKVISAYTSSLWNEQYAGYKAVIDKASSIDELKNIELIY